MLTLSIISAGVLVWLSAIAQHIANLTGVGAKWVMSDRSQSVPDDGFVGRSARALRNNLESCAMYVPAALMVLVHHQSSSVNAITAGVYTAVRVVFTVCYWAKLNSPRSLSWLVGMICVAVMVVSALQAITLPLALADKSEINTFLSDAHDLM